MCVHLSVERAAPYPLPCACCSVFGLRKGVECYASSNVTYVTAGRGACDAGCPPALAASWGPPYGGRPLQCGGINATSMYTLGEHLLPSLWACFLT